MGYIYKISNTINGKIYIGQTILLPERRWRQHELSSINASRNDHNLPVHYAMKKYGLENFTYEVIEECDDDLLNEREIFWIAHFDSTNPDIGYNLSLGGGGTAYYKMDEILDLWQRGKNIGQIAAELEIDRGFLGLRLKQEGVTQGEINMRRYASAREKTSFPVFQYSLDGTFLREYPSVQVARKETDIGHIEKCCNGQQKQAGGYIWSYSKCDCVAPVENDNPRTKKRPVFQYDLSGIQVSSYPSAYHAKKATGIDQTAIKNVCIGENYTAGGYIWRYEDSPQIQVVLPNNTGKSRCVGKYDAQTGELIETYCSLAEAAKKNNIAISGISSACTGRYKSCGGFIWRHISGY